MPAQNQCDSSCWPQKSRCGGLGTRLMSRISLGLRRVAARERGVASHGACGRSLPCLYGRSLRLRASSQAHYGVDEDEEWWPGRVLGVHSQGAHTVASTTTASSSSKPNGIAPNPNPNPSPNTNPKPNPNQASPSSLGRRGACGCRGPYRCGLIVCLSSRRFDRCAQSWFSLRFCLKPL
jgi:hypothetical protein